MTIEAICRVISMFGCYQELIYNIGIGMGQIIAIGIFSIEGRAHIDSIQPYLIGINLLMPKTAIGIAWMAFELAIQQIQCFLITFFLLLLVDAEKEKLVKYQDMKAKCVAQLESL